MLVLFAGALFGADHFETLVSGSALLTGPWGMAGYVAIAVLATVVAPFTALPLMPLAAALWGPLITALLTIAGWTLGSVLAFLLARTYGRPLVERVIPLERAEALSERLVGADPFWRLVLLRVVVPVDILSYAVGLFVPMPLGRYTLATILGITPFALIFAYAEVVPTWVTTTLVLGALVVLVTLFIRSKR